MSSRLASLQAHFPRPRHTILAVEDHPLLRLEIADEFRRHGFKVFDAADAHAAYCLLQSEAVDLLFTDIQLGNMQLPGAVEGGLALAKFVRATCPGVKVIIASGHVRTEANLAMADACFSKPYNVVRIVAEIRRLLADHDPRPAPPKWRKPFACAKAAVMDEDGRDGASRRLH